MAATSIEWTDATWNPIRARDRKTGKVGHYCELCSPGCANCYASAFQRRFGLPMYAGPGQREERTADLELFLDERVLAEPLRWKKPRRVFVCSMTDLFGSWVPDEWIDRCFAVMALTPLHTHQVLTKRPERMAAYITRTGRSITYLDDAARTLGYTLRFDTGNGHPLGLVRWPLPNVWLGTSVEDQPRADERIPHLLRTPAAVRFLSCEPLLGAVDLTKLRLADGSGWWNGLNGKLTLKVKSALQGHPDFWAETEEPIRPGIGRVIVGGESGPGARPCDVAWVRSLVGQCRAVGVPCFVKQVGANPYQSFGHVGVEPLKLRDRKGGTPEEWPADLRVRQFPAGAAP